MRQTVRRPERGKNRDYFGHRRVSHRTGNQVPGFSHDRRGPCASRGWLSRLPFGRVVVWSDTRTSRFSSIYAWSGSGSDDLPMPPRMCTPLLPRVVGRSDGKPARRTDGFADVGVNRPRTPSVPCLWMHAHPDLMLPSRDGGLCSSRCVKLMIFGHEDGAHDATATCGATLSL